MSLKHSLWWSEEAHLYFDYADELDGPHAYLRVDRGLVKALKVVETPEGLSITIRLPPEAFPILRPDLRRKATELGRPLDVVKLRRALSRLRRARPRGKRTPPVEKRAERTTDRPA